MKRQLLSLIGVFAVASISAQSPEIEAWMLNTTGHQASYDYYPGPPPSTANEQMTDSSDVKTVCYNSSDFYVRCNGLASYTMGPWSNPNVPTSQDYTFKITRNPTEETGTNTNTPFGGAQAVAINGVVMFGYGDGKSYSSAQGSNVGNGDGNWDTDAWIAEGTTMDASGGGHPTGGGKYHYHATPFTLYTDPSTGHSVIIGYAFDGYPIYGPFGYTNPTNSTGGVSRMVSSYELRSITTRDILPDGSTSTPAGPSVSGSFPLGTYVQDYEYNSGSGTLDEFNGRYCVTPEYPAGTYAYFLSTDGNGDPQFPYILAGSYYGTVSQMDVNSAGSSTSPAGLTCYTGATTGIEESSATLFNLYPNPASDIVNIQFENDSNNEVLIFDISGKIVLSEIVNSSSDQLDVHALTSGLYILSVKNIETGATEKIRLIIE